MTTSVISDESAPAAPRPAPLLRVENLRTTIHTARGDLRAVDGVSLTLARGEMLGVVGESGSGKSVLGRTVMGLHRTGPTMTVSGLVEFDGQDVHAMSPRALRSMWGSDVGMVFQDPMTALNPVKRVGTHLTETLHAHRGLGRAAARGRAVELLDLVGIPDPARRITQYPHELSGGMRQRVVIAMALANDPKLLIADEPTTALDVTVQRQILDLLERLQRELGTAVILISHNLGVVAGRADRVAVMYGGRIAETAHAADLFVSPRHPYTEALLSAIPRLDDPPHARLRAIDGAPPDMVHPPAGCRFAPRCAYVHDDCTRELPVLASGRAGDESGHLAACFHPVANANRGER
ncbi:ABC transporter ATP-binding protein [Rhodococcus sp. HNM0569]|uniref:ABC transporter ATP-binding protein n=1 Tax=Rhodococcus sp. HNM0569 TaxID=2716340 RepID=UPI00146DE7E7|nr:ABC transporter ATP-binding protein [Rhodococcus sp. HNM0569]NLU84097.1 ABC transporter ATP-binding protein [Rhodococcus sp. HNM0569]